MAEMGTYGPGGVMPQQSMLGAHGMTGPMGRMAPTMPPMPMGGGGEQHPHRG